MAKSSIELEIKSKYDGEGFKKADQAVKSFSKGAKTATDSVSKVTHALGTLDGKAGKIASSLGGIFSAFAHGGAVGLAIAGITTAFSLVAEKMQQAKENAKRVAEDIYKSFSSRISKIGDEFNNVVALTKRVEIISNSHLDVVSKLTTNESIIQSNELKGQNVNEDNIVEKVKRQNEINRIARETALATAQNDVEKAYNTLKSNEKFALLKQSEFYAASRSYRQESNILLAPIKKQIADAEQSYANTGYTNLGVKELIYKLRSKKTTLESILEGRLKPHGRDAEESDFTDDDEIQAFKMYKEFTSKNNKLEKDATDYGIQKDLSNNSVKVAMNNLEKIKSDNELGEKQDQKALEDAIQKSYEERAKVEEEAWKQAEKDLKDQEELYRKAAEERDKFEAEAEKQVEQQKRKEDAEKKQADVEKKHADKIKELDKRIEDAKERQAKAQEIQDFFANGGRASDWYKDENHGDESKNKADRNKEKGINALKAKLSHYKDGNGKWLRNFSPSDMDDANTLERDIAKLEADYKKDYDSEMKAIEAEKKKLEKDNHDNLKAIADALKNGGVLI